MQQQQITDTIADIKHKVTTLGHLIAQTCETNHPETKANLPDAGADVLGNIAEFAGIRLPGARSPVVATYLLVSCLTKRGDAVSGCRNVRASLEIICSAVFEFVKEHKGSRFMGLNVEGPGNMGSNYYSSQRLQNLQEQQFNQWWTAETTQQNIESRMRDTNNGILLSVAYTYIHFTFGTSSMEDAQGLMQGLVQALWGFIRDD